MPVETDEQLLKLLETSEESIRAATNVASKDLKRPRYHFRAPAQWMDDPNGIIYHEGYYHIMYSLNPNSSEQRAGMVYKTVVRVWDTNSPDWTGGITAWGHARSKDLVHWEHLPIALRPSIEKGEHFIWFGCTVINDEGVPMAIYTAIGPEMRPEDTAEQWAQAGSSDLIHWSPVASNPLMTNAIHNGQDNIREWRDPFLFREAGRTFMVLGAHDRRPTGDVPVVCLYEALNPGYTKWQYRGIVFEMPPTTKAPSAECPNLVKLGDKWLLLISPHGPVEYFVGQFDLETYKFTAGTSGFVDRSSNYYATNLLFDDKGRCIMWGALVGFTGTSGWNGCVSLPRVVEIDSKGAFVQYPVPELEALRGSVHVSKGSDEATAAVAEIKDVKDGGALELLATIAHGDQTFEIKFATELGDLSIISRPDGVEIGGRKFAGTRNTTESEIQVFIDNTVIEVYVDKTICHTLIVPLLGGKTQVSVTSQSDGVTADVKVWELRADDLFEGCC